MHADSSVPPVTDCAHSLPELVLLIGHSAGVRSVALSPDGTFLATTGGRKMILWDANSGEIRRVWEPDGGVAGVTFSPDGASLFASESGLSVRSVQSGSWQGTFPHIGSPIVLTPDGRRIIGTDWQSFLILDSASGELLRRVPFDEHNQACPQCVAIAPDGSAGAIGGLAYAYNEVRVWDLSNGELLRVIRGDAGCYVTVLAVSPKSRLVAMNGGDGIQLWDPRAGKLRHSMKSEGVEHQAAAFSNDAKLLAVGTSHGAVQTWSVRSGRPRSRITGHTTWVRALAFSADDAHLVSGSDDKTVMLWRTATGECLRQFVSLDFEAEAVAYSPDGKHVAVAYSDATVRLWSAKTGRLEHVLCGRQPATRSLAFTADSRVVLTGLAPQAAAWCVETGAPERHAEQDRVDDAGSHYRLHRALSPNGRWLATATRCESGVYPYLLELTDAITGRLVRTLPVLVDSGFVVGLSFSADSNTLVGGHGGGCVCIWDVELGALLQSFVMRGCCLTSLALSPDGATLAIGRACRSYVTLHDPRSGAEHARLLGHEGLIAGVAFSPDGTRLASVAADTSLKLWDPVCGQLVATLLPLPSTASGPSHEWIAHTPNGYYVSSPGAGPFIRWRVGADLLPEDVYSGTYNRPDFVAARLSG